MTNVPKSHLRVARVLAEDDKQVTLEVMKSDDTPMTLAQGIDPAAEPDRFLTILFVHTVDGAGETWLPWEEGA